MARRAGRQHGVIDRDQLLDLGFTHREIRYRVRCGRLRRIHHNVYAVGAQPLSREGWWFAALLASRPDPLLSHLSSLAKMGLARERNVVHVTVTHRGGRNLRGVAIHRCRSVDPADVTRIDDLPLTALPRTLLDVAETDGERVVVKALEEADRRGLLDPLAIAACIERNPGRRGLAVLPPLVGEFVSTPGAEEGLEREFQLFLRDRGLPLPLVNTLVDGVLVDCWWPEANLVVELDSRGWHGTWAARERDIDRDAKHLLAGRRPLRVTWRRLTKEPDALEADLRALLGSA